MTIEVHNQAEFDAAREAHPYHGPDARYPTKVKAKGCCAPVFECDDDGEPVAAGDGA